MLIFTAVNDFIDFFLLSIFCFCISYLFFFFLLEPCKKNILITSTKLDLCPLIHLSLIFYNCLKNDGYTCRNPNMKRMTGPIFLALYVEGSVSFSQFILKTIDSNTVWGERGKTYWIGCRMSISQCGWLYQPKNVYLNQLPQTATSQFKEFSPSF